MIVVKAQLDALILYIFNERDFCLSSLKVYQTKEQMAKINLKNKELNGEQRHKYT